MGRIESTAELVFKDKGFAVAHHTPGTFVFEKKGTSMNTLVYGDWSPDSVWVRVKLFVRELPPSPEVLVECNAYMVSGDHGDIRFEEEHKLTRMHRGKYQDLLEEISKRLQ